MRHITLTTRRWTPHLIAVALLGVLGVVARPAPVSAAEPAFVAMVPGRLLDTRPGEPTVDGLQQGTGAVGARGVVEVQVTGRMGIPADAAAVMLNVTAVTPAGPGFLTAYPCGTNPPLTASVNYVAGQIVPNAALSQVGAGGKVCIYTLAASHVVVDVTGYVPAGGGVSTMVPGRLLDTRPGEPTVDGLQQGTGVVGARGVVEVQVTGRMGIPADAAAVMLNVTAVTPAGPGFLTAYPCGTNPPLTASVNYVAGQIVPNAALSQVGAGGKVCIYTLAASHVVVDVTGYVPAGGGVSTMVPGRLLDTRPGEPTVDGLQQGTGVVGARGVVEVQVTGRMGIPADAAAVMLNVTAVTPAGPGFLTAYPCGTNPPLTASVNYVAGQIVPNAALSQVGAGGKVCIYTLAASHVVVDVTGYVPGPSGPGPGPGTGAPAIYTQMTVSFTEQEVVFDDQGTVHMVHLAEYGKEVRYARCAANCSTEAGWTSATILDFGEWTTVGIDGIGVDESGRIHVVLVGADSIDPFTALYATCAADCHIPAAWSSTDLSGRIGDFTFPSGSSTMTVTPPGTVSFLATGFSDSVEREVRYLQCTSGCSTASNWSMTPLFVGAAVSAVRHPNGTIHVAFAEGESALDNDGLGVARCSTNCTTARNWQVSPTRFQTADTADRARLAVTTSGRVYLGFPRGKRRRPALGRSLRRRHLHLGQLCRSRHVDRHADRGTRRGNGRSVVDHVRRAADRELGRPDRQPVRQDLRRRLPPGGELLAAGGDGHPGGDHCGDGSADPSDHVPGRGDQLLAGEPGDRRHRGGAVHHRQRPRRPVAVPRDGRTHAARPDRPNPRQLLILDPALRPGSGRPGAGAAARRSVRSPGMGSGDGSSKGALRAVPRTPRFPARHGPPRPPLVGRDDDLRLLVGLLDEHRLITLTGTGGVGKTSLASALAARVAAQLGTPTLEVPLAAVRQAPQVLETVVSRAGWLMRGREDPFEVLVEQIAGDPALVVLDNLEQVVSVGPTLTRWIDACPELRLVVTSRTPLRVEGETVFTVEPLAVPPASTIVTAHTITGSAAVELFVERARQVEPGFRLTDANAADLLRICRRLDGLPLAIELAAARMDLMGPSDLAALIEHRPDVLRSRQRALADERHRTLQATIEWSYDLLDPELRRIFRAIAVFAGGFRLEALTAVAGLDQVAAIDALGELIDHGLVRRIRVGAPAATVDLRRYGSFEVIREFALAELVAAGELEPTAAAHARWCTELVDALAPKLTGDDPGAAIAELEADVENLRGDAVGTGAP